MAKMLEWKKELRAVMDNPDYIELQITAIEKELKKNRPDTDYLREKIKNMEKWTGEIDLAKRRALGKVV